MSAPGDGPGDTGDGPPIDRSRSVARRVARMRTVERDELTEAQRADADARALAHAETTHAACVALWDNLSPAARKGTTFHGLDGHLPPGHPARQP